MQYPPILYKDITILLVLTQAATMCHTSYYRMNASLIRMAQNEGDADNFPWSRRADAGTV